MFNKDTTDYKGLSQRLEENVKDLRQIIEDNDKEHGYEIKDLKKEIELKEKDFKFQLEHQESEGLKKKDAEIVELTKKLAVADEKIKMLDKIVDLNSDVIDVKKLVEQLINKLPEVKISSLAVTSQESKK